MKNFLVALGLIVMLSPFCTGQTKPKSKVMLSCQGSDILGRTLCSKLRDTLALSPRFTEVPDTADNYKNYVEIHILTVTAAGTEGDETTTAMSVIYTHAGFLLHHSVSTCGRDRINDCATDVVIGLDNDFVSGTIMLSDALAK